MNRFQPRAHGARRLLAVLLATVVPVVSTPLVAQPLPDLAGTWEGTLVNLPSRVGAPTVAVTIELGAIPTATGQCAPWKTTYREAGVVRGVKDYRICRGADAGELFVDEGNNVRLRATLLGDVLVSAFKAGSILLVTHLRVRGDTLEEEIVTIADAPATDSLVTLSARSVQRIVAVRRRSSSRTYLERVAGLAGERDRPWRSNARLQQASLGFARHRRHLELDA